MATQTVYTIFMVDGVLVPMKPWKRCLKLSPLGRECTRMRRHLGKHIAHRFGVDRKKRPEGVLEEWQGGFDDGSKDGADD